MDWAQRLSNQVVESFWRSVIAPIQSWFDQYPWLEWLLQHPVWLVGVVLLVIFLFAGLIQAIGRLTENIWLTLLLLPFRVVRWMTLGLIALGRWAVKGQRRGAAKAIEAELSPAHSQGNPQIDSQTSFHANPEHRLQELLDRLDAIRLEEEALLKEVRKILATQEGKAEGKQV